MKILSTKTEKLPLHNRIPFLCYCFSLSQIYQILSEFSSFGTVLKSIVCLHHIMNRNLENLIDELKLLYGDVTYDYIVSLRSTDPFFVKLVEHIRAELKNQKKNVDLLNHPKNYFNV